VDWTPHGGTTADGAAVQNKCIVDSSGSSSSSRRRKVEGGAASLGGWRLPINSPRPDEIVLSIAAV